MSASSETTSFEACLDIIIIDLLGCAMPRAGAFKPNNIQATAKRPQRLVPRPGYSTFDLRAGTGTNFLLNLSITAVVPMVLVSAESRDHPTPLAGSGSVVGATSIGMVVSIITMYTWPEALVDGKLAFYVFAWLLLLGNMAFFAAEALALPIDMLFAARVLMSLGFGAGFAAKRRAGLEPDPQRREYHFLRLELANSLGMAGGPIMSGALAVMLPAYAKFVPPLLMVGLSLCFLLMIFVTPLEDFSLNPPRASEGGAISCNRGVHEATPLVTGAVSRPGADPAGPGGGGTGGRDAECEGGTSSQVAAGGGAADAGAPSVVTSMIVQVAMLLFGVSRNFLKFGFESAMVVVYDRQFYFSAGASGVIAGCCALSTVMSLFLYKGVCMRRISTHSLLLIAETFGLVSALLMMATGQTLKSTTTVSLAAAAGLTRADRGQAPDVRYAEVRADGRWRVARARPAPWDMRPRVLPSCPQPHRRDDRRVNPCLACELNPPAV